MLSVPIFDMQGERKGDAEIDPAVLGGRVRPELIKQVIVAYQDHQRQRSARTKGRAQVEGSTRKLYRQKGTGNARAGSIRTPVRRGGGRTFAKRIPGASKDIPKKMRRLARNQAILAKIQADDVVVVDGLECKEPKTRVLVAMLSAIGATRGSVVALHEYNRDVYLSGRNIPDTEIRVAADLNAYEVLRRPKLIFSKPAFERLAQRGPAATEAGSSD